MSNPPKGREAAPSTREDFFSSSFSTGGVGLGKGLGRGGGREGEGGVWGVRGAGSRGR